MVMMMIMGLMTMNDVLDDCGGNTRACISLPCVPIGITALNQGSCSQEGEYPIMMMVVIVLIIDH